MTFFEYLRLLFYPVVYLFEHWDIPTKHQDTTPKPQNTLSEPISPQEPPPAPLPPPKPVLTAGVDLEGHSPEWRGGTLEERRAMYRLAKRVCQEEGLTPQMTQDVLLTIYGESGFNQWCINLRTFDYGLCQFSKRFYLVEYVMTPQEAIDNPERCVRIMARNFKAGRQSNWVAYATRAQNAAALAKLAVDNAPIPA